MRRSWLTPATDVHRSAFPVSVTRQLSVRFTVIVNEEPSIAFQLLPSLLFSTYWLVLTPSIPWLAGRDWTGTVVGGYAGPRPRARQTAVPGLVLLPFDTHA